MCQSNEEAIRDLEALGFPSHHARVYVNAKGRCEYCGRDLIEDRIGYGSIQIDHIFPQSKGGDDSLDNLALSCSICNSVKSDWISVEIDSTNRHGKLVAARLYIEKKMENHNTVWNGVRRAMRKVWFPDGGT